MSYRCIPVRGFSDKIQKKLNNKNMTTNAIIALCVGALLFGLGSVFFMMWFFFNKGKREEDAARQQQANVMSRIDELFPSIEKLLRDGIKVPTPIAENEEAAEAYSRHQDDEDAAIQQEIEKSNNISETERAAEAPKTLFEDGGGFVS
ncbi:MAG: hypothetical protein LBT70_04770 [Holosporaceae bacterium]|nr:hypothetical protein [Holosporaceae bacterium]